MKFTEAQYLEAMQGYFSPDEEISHEVIKLVKTRKLHDCMGVDKDDDHDIAAGEMAICETAIHVDHGRVTCYVCLPCADKWVSEIFPQDDDDEMPEVSQ